MTSRQSTIEPGRRRLLTTLAGVGVIAALPGAGQAQKPPPLNDRMTGDLAPVHDPCIIKEGDTYHLFCTGHVGETPGLLPWRTSKDLVRWTLKGEVLPALPAWAGKQVPGTRGTWAPDIAFFNGRHHLYYSLSTFGSNRSAIGLLTTANLDAAGPGTGWTDQGVVFASEKSDPYNAIDPNILIASDGRHWMSFGSFWSGLKMIELDPATGKPKSEAKLLSIAERARPGAVEAPFIIERDGWFYLFASYDFCCRGAKSTYYTIVGRSKDVTGAYVDREGKRLLDGGGFLVLHADLDTTKRFRGPGHVAILRDPGQDYIVHHAYDTRSEGRPTLRIQPLGWTADGWPVAV